MFADVQTSYLRALFVVGLVVATLFTAASAGLVSPFQSALPVQKAKVVETYGKLPLSFEANTGQAEKNVKFLSRGRGYGLYLTGNGAELMLCQTASSAARTSFRRTPDPMPKSAECDVVRMQVPGASGNTEPAGEDELPGTVNYFIGSDPAKWRSNILTYAKVRYRSIYPGIDLVYYGNQQQVEFDFVVAPHADPRLIRLRLGGASTAHLAPNGDAVVTIENGKLAFHKPLIYQMVDGHRRPVGGEFASFGKHTLGFRLGSYDRAKALVIDPVLEYSTFLGGSGNPNWALIGGNAYAVAVDAAGNAYVAGVTVSTDFPTTPGAFQTTNQAAAINGSNAFITKLNPSGTTLVYSTYLGGSGGDQANGIAVDAAGDAYVTGWTYSTDFPVTAGAFQTSNKNAANGGNAFITKLNPTGTALVYSTFLGGSLATAANAIALDAAGDAYVAGQTGSTDFPVTAGAFQSQNKAAANKASNAFVTELNPAGSALVYSTYLGGSGAPIVNGNIGSCRSAQFVPTGEEDGATAIAIDAAGNAYVTGTAVSADFPVTAGAYQTQNNAAAKLLFPSFNRAALRGLQTRTWATCGCNRSCNQAAEVPSSKVTDSVPRSPAKNSRIVAAFVSRMHSITNLPLASMTATEIVAWCTSIPIYFAWFMTALLVADHHCFFSAAFAYALIRSARQNPLNARKIRRQFLAAWMLGGFLGRAMHGACTLSTCSIISLTTGTARTTPIALGRAFRRPLRTSRSAFTTIALPAPESSAPHTVACSSVV